MNLPFPQPHDKWLRRLPAKITIPVRMALHPPVDSQAFGSADDNDPNSAAPSAAKPSNSKNHNPGPKRVTAVTLPRSSGRPANRQICYNRQQARAADFPRSLSIDHRSIFTPAELPKAHRPTPGTD